MALTAYYQNSQDLKFEMSKFMVVGTKLSETT